MSKPEQPVEETPTEEISKWAGEGKDETEVPKTPEEPLFKLLREIKEAVLSKEQQRAHHLDKIATATNRMATALEKLANLPKTSVTTAPIAKPIETAKTPEVPVKPVETPAPATPSAIDKVKAYFPEDLLGLLKFEDIGDYVKVAPRQYLGSENFAKIASIIRDNGGEYISAGKDSHFRIGK